VWFFKIEFNIILLVNKVSISMAERKEVENNNNNNNNKRKTRSTQRPQGSVGMCPKDVVHRSYVGPPLKDGGSGTPLRPFEI
jgi:hypothetical protein